jgi:hypothetical protein
MDSAPARPKCNFGRAVQMSEFTEAIKDGIDASLLSVHTGVPGKVVSYDLAKGVADIDLMIPLDGEKISTLKSVRIGFYQTSATFISLPIKAGDFCYVLFAEQSLEKWRASKGAFQYLDDHSRHHLNGSWAMPFLYPDSAVAPAHADNIVIGRHSGVQIHIKPDNSIEIMSASGGVKIDGDLHVTGKVDADGEMTAMASGASVTVSKHKHPTGTGPSGPPTPGT